MDPYKLIKLDLTNSLRSMMTRLLLFEGDSRSGRSVMRGKDKNFRERGRCDDSFRDNGYRNQRQFGQR